MAATSALACCCVAWCCDCNGQRASRCQLPVISWDLDEEVLEQKTAQRRAASGTALWFEFEGLLFSRPTRPMCHLSCLVSHQGGNIFPFYNPPARLHMSGVYLVALPLAFALVIGETHAQRPQAPSPKLLLNPPPHPPPRTPRAACFRRPSPVLVAGTADIWATWPSS
jgi:hypothetical protein